MELHFAIDDLVERESGVRQLNAGFFECAARTAQSTGALAGGPDQFRNVQPAAGRIGDQGQVRPDGADLGNLQPARERRDGIVFQGQRLAGKHGQAGESGKSYIPWLLRNGDLDALQVDAVKNGKRGVVDGDVAVDQGGQILLGESNQPCGTCEIVIAADQSQKQDEQYARDPASQS